MTDAIIRREGQALVSTVNTYDGPVQMALRDRGYYIGVNCTDNSHWLKDLGEDKAVIQPEIEFLSSLGLQLDEKASQRMSAIRECYLLHD